MLYIACMYYSQLYGIQSLAANGSTMSLDVICCSEFKHVLETVLTCEGNAVAISCKSCQVLADTVDKSRGRRVNGTYESFKSLP